jgi:cyclase
MQFNLNGNRVDAVCFPRAHSDGDSVVYFKDANIVHTGYLFFNGMYPFIDVDNGGSIFGLIAAVQKLIATNDESIKIIPGHGPLASRADLIGFSGYADLFKRKCARPEKTG